MAERVNILYNGFELSVLPILEYGPPPANPKFSYSAFICRPGDAESKDGGKKYFFSHPLPDFLNEAAAVAAGLQRAKLIIDGNDPVHPIPSL